MKKKTSSSTLKFTSTLYIVHGWAYSLDPWQKTLQGLKKNGVKFKLLKVPGLTKPSQKVWSIDDYVAWLDKEFKSVKNLVVLGHSNGGRLLLNYCLQKPTRVKHLILLNSAGVLPTAKQRRRHRFLKQLSKSLGFLKKIKILRKLVHRILRLQDYQKAAPNMKATLHNMLISDRHLSANYRKIKAPVSLIWGEDDQVTPLRQALRLNSQLPNVKSFKVLKGVRHAPYATHPRILVEAILDILQKL